MVFIELTINVFSVHKNRVEDQAKNSVLLVAKKGFQRINRPHKAFIKTSDSLGEIRADERAGNGLHSRTEVRLTIKLPDSATQVMVS